MAYNLLSGTVIANETVVISPNDGGENLIFGDGTNISNVARVVANGTTDFMVTVGANADSLVGEPNLQFNGSRLYVNGNITASAVHLPSLVAGTATTASYLALDTNNNIVLTSSSGSGVPQQLLVPPRMALTLMGYLQISQQQPQLAQRLIDLTRY